MTTVPGLQYTFFFFLSCSMFNKLATGWVLNNVAFLILYLIISSSNGKLGKAIENTRTVNKYLITENLVVVICYNCEKGEKSKISIYSFLDDICYITQKDTFLVVKTLVGILNMP